MPLDVIELSFHKFVHLCVSPSFRNNLVRVNRHVGWYLADSSAVGCHLIDVLAALQ